MPRSRCQLAVRDPNLILLLPLLARPHRHAPILRTKSVDTSKVFVYESGLAPRAASREAANSSSTLETVESRPKSRKFSIPAQTRNRAISRYSLALIVSRSMHTTPVVTRMGGSAKQRVASAPPANESTGKEIY